MRTVPLSRRRTFRRSLHAPVGAEPDCVRAGDYTLSARGIDFCVQLLGNLPQRKVLIVRKRDLVPTDARVVRAPLLLTAALVTWAATVVSEKSWLYALVIAVVGVADLPLVARVRERLGTLVALLIHAGVLVVGWFVALLVWAPFVHWE